MKIKPTPGQLVRNAGRTLYRMALITRVWQDKPHFSPQVEVVWTHYPSRPEMVGTTTQIDSRRFADMENERHHPIGYIIVQDEGGKPAPP